MKITEIRTRTFNLPHEDHAFAPTWQRTGQAMRNNFTKTGNPGGRL